MDVQNESRVHEFHWYSRVSCDHHMLMRQGEYYGIVEGYALWFRKPESGKKWNGGLHDH